MFELEDLCDEYIPSSTSILDLYPTGKNVASFVKKVLNLALGRNYSKTKGIRTANRATTCLGLSLSLIKPKIPSIIR